MRIEPIYRHLGIVLREHRKLAGMTQEALGAKLRPPQTCASIANIESGKQRVPAHVLDQIARALKIQVTLG